MAWLSTCLLLLAGCDDASREIDIIASTAASLRGPAVTAASAMVWGVTTDDPTKASQAQVEALRSFARRVTVRTVFDLENSAAHYRPAVLAMSKVADVMGQPLDSSDMKKVSLPAVRTRMEEYLATLGDVVKLWEIGNEMNGDWLGSDAMGKAEAMFDAVERTGHRTALTLYYETKPAAGHAMLPWVDARIPPGHRMRSGLDYVFVSYYEDQNGGHVLSQAEIEAMFSALAARFPNARVGFGEFGWGGRIPRSSARRASLIRRFYQYRVPSVASYVGGGFYWHFRQTMTPTTRPDWRVLNGVMTAR